MIEFAEKITGWMSEKELHWLADHAKEAELILEFGCYQGRSTRALADNTEGVVYAVDPWGLPYFNDDGTQSTWIDTENAYSFFKENLKDHIESGKVIPIQDYSWAFITDKKFDLIFIDGDHRYEAVKNDIRIAKQYIKPGGIISGHDYFHGDWPGVKKAVDEAFPITERLGSIWFKRMNDAHR